MQAPSVPVGSGQSYEDEAIDRLADQIALIEFGRRYQPSTLFERCLMLHTSYRGPYCGWQLLYVFKQYKLNRFSPRPPQENRDRAKEVFGLLMRARLRRESDENVFQPCEDDLEFLKGMDPALCATLRRGKLVDFCRILHPVDSVLNQTIGCKQRPCDEQTIKSSLRRKDSIFNLHGNKTENGLKEFKDLTLRAEALAEAIVKHKKCRGPFFVPVDLLDGHGTMLVCIIKAIMDLGFDPDKVLLLRIFGTDDQVHKYHQYVFPQCIETVEGSIITYIRTWPNRGVIYLNFCSITSGGDGEAWKNHFQSQTIYNWVPHCCKENVLKYIWEVTHPPYCCTVMVSLVIKDVKELGNGVYHAFFREKLGHYITGFGFLYLLRKKDLFDAEIVSVRPENGIIWKDGAEKRQPKRLRWGRWGYPFVTLLVRPKQSKPRKERTSLHNELSKWKIADLQEETMQIGARVQIQRGFNRGTVGKIIKRTAAMVTVEDEKGIEYNVRLSSCKPY